uniref:UDP-glucose:glycoprotein glucosyltransferase n=1 Tax=Caenorhabditis japonica TaxID=281687 RepID=A0A8R1DR12_CAEJA
MRIDLKLLLLSILFILSRSLTVKSGTKSVKSSLHTNWKQTSLFAETSEYLATENEDNFWEFVKKVHERSNGSRNSQQYQYETSVAIAKELLPHSEMGLLRLSLSMRAMSPRVEMHRRLGSLLKPDNCDDFFVFEGQSGCNLDELDTSTKTRIDEEVFEFDHIYPVGSTALKTIVIYGELGSYQLKLLVEKARELADSKNDLRFVLRHSIPNDSLQSLVSLSGYGVELAMKNTEYKAVDAQNNDNEPENLHGLNFRILNERHKQYTNQLELLRENLEKTGEIVPLKSWQLSDIGFKACQKIAEDKDLDVTEKMLQDFPLHANEVSNVHFDNYFKMTVKQYIEVMKSKGIGSGKNILAVNGIIVGTENKKTDVFTLINTLKAEQKAIIEFSDMGFGSEIDLSRLISSVDLSPMEYTGCDYALDYREALPSYLNDLESSSEQLGSLDTLLEPYPPGQVRRISRNIFTVIIISDPFEQNDDIFKMVEAYVKHGIHIRVGLVPVFDERRNGMTVSDAVRSKQVSAEKQSFWKSQDDLLSAIHKGNQFLKKSGLSNYPITLLNGYPLNASAATFEKKLFFAIDAHTANLQYALYTGTLQNDVNISDWFLSRETNPDFLGRVSGRIKTAFNEKRFVNFDASFENELTYLSRDGASLNADVTSWVVADFDTKAGRKLAVEILKSSAVEDNNKVALISNPKDIHKKCTSDSDTLILEELKSIEEIITALQSEGFSSVCSVKNASNVFSVTGIHPGEMATASNGMIIGPLIDEDEMISEDFDYLNGQWMKKNAEVIASVLNYEFRNDVSIQFYSTLAKIKNQNMKRKDFSAFKDFEQINMVSYPPQDLKSQCITVTWVVNPLSREAQQIVSIVKLIRSTVNARIELIFNPLDRISEMPITRFYRFVASNELSFDEDGTIENHSAIFANLPQKQLLTMSMQTNDAWMIEVKQAEYDLDNIMLETSAGDVEGVFSLEHILVEGQSNYLSGQATHGLEIELQSREKVYDTIVMLNLGYFQLKADPGVWNLRLRNGESEERNEIIEVDSKNVGDNIRIFVDSFAGKWSILTVKKRQKPEETLSSSILSIFESAKNYFLPTEDQSEVINIFSLASGHLYERFLRIMIVSVMKRTNTKKVKFWLLKNYLSPKFKEAIPLLAEHYGFEFEFVEYKWPTWLRQQTEKQRIMWGYKILFLDVLFPLNVDKVIFVDADQVVRADLQELMDIDLKGAAYGYVPFCESREEMDGFRFWASGYWKDHLKERRYHISALYVVDLKTFRSLSAGDELRGRYFVLSIDPRSLANLDQDLPNQMIHEVPIESLPQDWLWCETWCSDSSKESAKTIDLCNNPLTKEPKLDSAQRIIPEWKDLDEEIFAVLAKENKTIDPSKVEL